MFEKCGASDSLSTSNSLCPPPATFDSPSSCLAVALFKSQAAEYRSYRLSSRLSLFLLSSQSQRRALLRNSPLHTTKMFFLYNLERQVTLHPSYFGRNMHELVTGKLLKDVEGTCTGQYYIITIMDTFNISEGRILPGSGLAEFTVGYRAVVWRPFKGETVRDWI